MKKQERKENANKGFSLVELIVVVAIMAVLIGVLAPQYLRYVEKTRLQKDNSAIAEVANAMKIAMAEEVVNTDTPDGTTVTIKNATDTAGATFDLSDANKAAVSTTTLDKLKTELTNVIGTFETSSNEYKKSKADIVLTIKNNGGAVSVEVAGWIDSVGTAATTTSSPKKF